MSNKHQYPINFIKGMNLLRQGIGIWLSERFTLMVDQALPKELHFLINGTRNSRCVMCKIWEQRAEREISLEEIRRILSDSLFKEVKIVVISGREPTLRKDSTEIVQALVEKLPYLKTVRICTNAIDTKMVWERICALKDVLDKSRKRFDVEIFLDGVGKINDLNRGVSGSFDSVAEVIEKVQKSNIPLLVRCTLTPLNCYYADDLLLWLEEKKIKDYAFRLAIEAARFYNEEYAREYSFSDSQIFHLVGFFDRLASMSAESLEKNLFYCSLVKQIAFGEARTADCVWQTNRDVTLDSCGNISYCLAQSPILGNGLETSAKKIYFDNQAVRDKIVLDKCDTCLYEFWGEQPAPAEIIKKGGALILGPWQSKWSTLKDRVAHISSINVNKLARKNRPQEWKNVLITGWYGTETTGDKAILGELLYILKSYNPEVNVSITTIDEKVSIQTNKELGCFDSVQIIDIERAHTPKIIDRMDAVIIGGGPLMETAQIENLWKIFRQANENKIARVIFGCGIGPIYTKRVEKIIGDICQLSTVGFFRDEQSYQYATKLGTDLNLKWACDPSLAFLRRWRRQFEVKEKQSSLKFAGLLREQTEEYYTGTDLNERNTLFAKHLGETFLKIIDIFPDSLVELLPMHMYWRGKDDRIFNRKIIRFVSRMDSVKMTREYLDIFSLLNRLVNADIAIAMRYHGHLFSMALGIPFLSINYSGKQGKVSNLIQEIGYQQYVVDYSSFDPLNAISRIENLVDRRNEISQLLLEKTDRLVSNLNSIYIDLFGQIQ